MGWARVCRDGQGARERVIMIVREGDFNGMRARDVDRDVDWDGDGCHWATDPEKPTLRPTSRRQEKTASTQQRDMPVRDQVHLESHYPSCDLGIDLHSDLILQ